MTHFKTLNHDELAHVDGGLAPALVAGAYAILGAYAFATGYAIGSAVETVAE